eukprot:67637_1
MATVHSASALLFSPLLLRANPWGIARHNISSNSRSKIVKISPQISQADTSKSEIVDFGQDDDTMRYKQELIGYVYEKSLTRGFVGSQDQ